MLCCHQHGNRGTPWDKHEAEPSRRDVLSCGTSHTISVGAELRHASFGTQSSCLIKRKVGLVSSYGSLSLQLKLCKK